MRDWEYRGRRDFNYEPIELNAANGGGANN